MLYLVRQNGAAVRIIRQLRGLSVDEACKQLGCSRTTVYRIEREITEARKETLHALAGLLDVPVAALRRDKDET